MIRTATCFAALLVLTAPAALAETKSYPAQAFSRLRLPARSMLYTHPPMRLPFCGTGDGDFTDVYLDFDGDTLVVSRNSGA